MTEGFPPSNPPNTGSGAKPSPPPADRIKEGDIPPPPDEPKRLRDVDWRIRNRIALGLMAFCAGVIAYALGAGKTGEVAETAVNGAFTLLGAVAFTYFAGAGVESWRKLK